MLKPHQLKNYKLIVSEDDDISSLPIKTIFHLSDLASEESGKKFYEIRKKRGNAAEKLKLIERVKKTEQKLLKDPTIISTIHKYFHVDGAIKLNSDDIERIKSSFAVFNDNGEIEPAMKNPRFELYLDNLVDNFGYRSAEKIIFRGEKYYFLFDSLKISGNHKNSSINDYRIDEFDHNEFIQHVAQHFNLINQNLILFHTIIFGTLYKNLKSSRLDFCRDALNQITPEIINNIRSRIQSGRFSTTNLNIDNYYESQWEKALKKLEKLREVIQDFEKSGNDDALHYIVGFLSFNNPLIRFAKVSFGIDLDHPLNKHGKIAVDEALKKVLLGLMDAKINILAFSQNLVQIVRSPQFLDPEFNGSLIFTQDIVRNMKKLCPNEFKEFKAQQKAAWEEDRENSLLGELDDSIALFLDVLLDDNSSAYIKIVGQAPSELPNLFHEKSSNIPIELESSLSLIRKFFEFFSLYTETQKLKATKAQAKKKINQKPLASEERYMLTKRTAFKRMIRLYREESDPTVMIKTAQNALNSIIARNFKPHKDVLHIMSVNYGGILTGFYAKHVFAKSVRRGQVLANASGLIYSIYDVKNANSFSKLVDYPFASFMEDKTVDDNVKRKLAEENWLLIFDDNTNSGDTLDNIRSLAKDSGFFDRIDVYPCRASHKLENYKGTLQDDQKLHMIVNSAMPTRRAKVNTEGIRYKELIGTIVGNRLWKIRNNRNNY